MLNSYGTLQTAIADWLNRADLTAQIPDFISLAEAKISRRLRFNSTRSTLNITTQTVTLPAAIAELRSIALSTGMPHLDKPLQIVTPEVISEMRAYQGGQVGRPRWASIIGNTLDVAPAPDAAYVANIIYFDALVPLTNAAPSNEVLVAAPDAYLFGALMQAAPFLEHDERIPVWQQKFDEAIDELNKQRDMQEFTGSIRPIRLPVVFG